MQVLLTLNDTEGTSKQALIRALMLHAKASPKMLDKAVRDAEKGAKIQADQEYGPGEKKGHSPQDYADAVAEAGTLSGAARILNVTHATVREQCKRHGIHVPSVGGVPE